MKKRAWIIGEALALGAAAAAILACGGGSAGSGGAVGDAPVMAADAAAEVVFGEVPEFAFTAQDGSTVTNATLLGAPYAVAAIFTSCSGPCPKITAGMRGLQDRLADTDVHLVSVSVDPVTDRPDVLTAYAESYTVNTSRWSFVTGDESVIHAFLREGLWLPLARAEGDVAEGEQVTHSTKIVAVDRHGSIRGWYDGIDADELAKLEQRLRFLAAEE